MKPQRSLFKIAQCAYAIVIRKYLGTKALARATGWAQTSRDFSLRLIENRN
jgi:hypothetical protein